MTGHNSHNRTPGQNATLSAVKAFVSALAMASLILLLASYNIGPFHRLEMLDELAYLKLRPPKLLAHPGTPPIILVDVDEISLQQWKRRETFSPSCSAAAVAPDVWRAKHPAGAVDAPAQGTPRLLLAEIVRAMRMNGAAVIFLDIDLRTGHWDDDALKIELGCTGTAPVLLPHYFENGLVPGCGQPKNKSGEDGLVTLDNSFGAAFHEGAGPPHVQPVHGVMSRDDGGYIDSICPSYRLRPKAGAGPDSVPAAMVRAVQIARKPDGEHGHDADADPSRELPLRWLVDAARDQARSETGSPVYVRVSASQLMRDRVVTPGSVSMKFDPPAIVIVGSSHAGASDVYSTPLGLMPGVLVQVNAGLSIMLEHETEFGPWAHFLLEAFFLLLCCLLIRFVLLFAYRKLKFWSKHHFIPHALESLLVLLGMAVFAVLGWGLSGFIFPTWSFAGLSFVLAAILVCVSEMFALLGDGCEALMVRSKRPTQDIKARGGDT